MDTREWKLRKQYEGPIEAQIAQLEKETGLSPITLRVCLMRGLGSAEAIQTFLHPRFDALTNPLKLRDMDRAVDRLSQARAAGDTIRIFGDYDVDGTTGAALLSRIFQEFGFKYSARQPDRFKDGYGLNVAAVEDAVRDGARLLVTVDCGITSFDAARKAQELGIDLIVVDHHQVDPGKGLPPAVAVINPQRTDCESQLRQLCGCGLAFYLAMALRMRGRAEGWFAPGAEPNLKQHLDLVVMATAADMVPLTGDNHVLVQHGLSVLRKSKKPGVRALLEVAGLGERDLSPGHLGFVIGPRINASGRIGSASLALELLTTEDSQRATALAQELEAMNKERAEIQNAIWDEVRGRVEKGISEGRYQHGIVVADPKWHEGVVGIVASRVTEMFRRPAAVIALREDFGKGSVRSYGGKDVLSALRSCAPYLLGFGGHKHAAGLSVAHEKLPDLEREFDQALGLIAEDAETKPLYIEGDCALEDLDLKTLQEIEKLGPFGPGNPEPVFSVRASIHSHRVLKGRHLKLSLSPPPPLSLGTDTLVPRRIARPTCLVDAIWFNAAEEPESLDRLLREPDAQWAGVPELNRFRGQITPTFRIRDRRTLSSG